MYKDKEVIILIGKSGSGKGTQAEFIKEYFSLNRNINLLHITTGAGFRYLSQGDSYISKNVKDTIDNGKLMPEFMAVWNWTNVFINKIKDDSSFILDGAPRKVNEAHLLENAFKFLDYKKVTVMYINVKDDSIRERLKLRGREDDDVEGIESRLKWFDTDVLPVIEYYKHNNFYEFIEVNGDDTSENISKDILHKLLKNKSKA